MVEVVENGDVHSWVQFQHLDYGNLTTHGYVLPSTILKLMESDLIYHNSNLSKLIKKNNLKPYLAYVCWQQCEITPEFWKLVFGRNPLDFLNQKWAICTKTDSIGKSSIYSHRALTDGSRKIVWVYNAMQTVMMDQFSRKPKALPENLKQYLKSNGDYSVINYEPCFPNLCNTKYDLPEGSKTFQRSSSISLFQTDYNNHVNHASYLEFCFDCLAEAVHFGFCTNMTESIFKYPVRRCSLLYLKESKLGDTVDTVVWQDASNLWVFHFHVLKNSEVICQAQLELCTVEDIIRKSELNL